MFDLDAADVGGLVVDCCAGASSFVSELASRGRLGVAVDPAHANGLDVVRWSATASLIAAGDCRRPRRRFVWHWYGSPARRGHVRAVAADGSFTTSPAGRPPIWPTRCLI